MKDQKYDIISFNSILSGDNLWIDIVILSKPQLFFDCITDKIFFISTAQVRFIYSGRRLM